MSDENAGWWAIGAVVLGAVAAAVLSGDDDRKPQASASGGSSPLAGELQDFDAQIATVERDMASCPRNSPEYNRLKNHHMSLTMQREQAYNRMVGFMSSMQNASHETSKILTQWKV